jgi:antitoxin CptB
MSECARLEWRCRRGTHELDLLLGRWLREGFDRSGEDERKLFLALLEWEDDVLARLLLGQETSSDPDVNALAARIRALSVANP